MLGRPHDSEAAPYYFTYINQVTGDNALATMEKQLPDALEFFAGITEKSSLHRYAPDKWSIREVLANRISWLDYVEEFRLVRLSTICLFKNLPPSAWSRQGIADGKPFTVRALAFIIAGHLTHHLAILRDRYF